jgi:hypothetical protein
MNTKLQNIIQEELTILPKEMRELINNFDWDKKIEEICKKYNFTEDKIFPLQIETSLVILGIVDPVFYYENIKNNVVLTDNESKEVEDEVNKKIFIPMYDILTENIKKSLKDKVINWQQNLNFILSGGDFTVFIRRQEKEEPKEKTLKFNPSNVEDLRSSFTI